MQEFNGGGDHYGNFLKPSAAASYEDLNADILEGHLSSALCHLGNISYRLGSQLSIREVKERLKELSSPENVLETYDRFTQHLARQQARPGDDQAGLRRQAGHRPGQRDVHRQLRGRRAADPRLSGAVRRAGGRTGLADRLPIDKSLCSRASDFPSRADALASVFQPPAAQLELLTDEHVGRPGLRNPARRRRRAGRRQARGHRHAGAAGYRQPGIADQRRIWRETRTAARIVYLGIPHRLDRPVSGAIVFAKTRRAARQLSRQFERRSVENLLGLRRADRRAAGRHLDRLSAQSLRPAAGLGRGRRMRRARRPSCAIARSAITAPARGSKSNWKPAARTRFACRPPRAGTRVWATRTTARACRSVRQSKTNACGIALHARSLAFVHPTTREPKITLAPLPANWSDWHSLRQLRCTRRSRSTSLAQIRKEVPQPRVRPGFQVG